MSLDINDSRACMGRASFVHVCVCDDFDLAVVIADAAIVVVV